MTTRQGPDRISNLRSGPTSDITFSNPDGDTAELKLFGMFGPGDTPSSGQINVDGFDRDPESYGSYPNDYRDGLRRSTIIVAMDRADLLALRDHLNAAFSE